MAGTLPDRRTPAVRGGDVARILKRLLAGSGLRAIAVDATTWRIESAPRKAPGRPGAPPAPLEAGDIIVTASKRDERLSDLPVSVSVVRGTSLGRLAGKRGLSDLLATADGAFSTNLGPGRDRLFLRGVADSAFNGTSQSLVSLYLDDARIGYSSPDPDLRLVDIDRVEVLRGPQGTLYGTGALGGVVRIVTIAPALDRLSGTAAIEGTSVNNGALGGAGEATINVPIVTGTLALRASGWSETMPGWIQDTGRHKSDVNRTTRTGGRAALRWAIGGGWNATISGVGQWINARDSQYATTGLSRATQIAEPQDNDFLSALFTVRGPIGRLDAQATTAVVAHDFGSTYDASVLAPAMGMTAPLAYDEDRSIRLLTQEVRLSDPLARHPWIVGGSILVASSRLRGSFETPGSTNPPARDDRDNVLDAALFAEGTQRLSSRLDLKIGLRAFLTASSIEQEGPEEQRTRTAGITPSATLSWHDDALGLVWLRYARADRPAGATRAIDTLVQRIPGDELQSVELGWRLHAAGDRISLHGALFGSTWEHLRSDVVGSDGLLGTVDAGNATNYGIELGGLIDTTLVAIDFGGTVQRARLTSPAQSQRDRDDRRLPVVPDLSARLGATHRFTLARKPATAYLSARYIGRTRLSFDPLLDRPAGNYVTVGAGATLQDGARRWSVDIDNLLDGRGNSFGFGNPFTLAGTTQTVPIRPRALTLKLAMGF